MSAKCFGVLLPSRSSLLGIPVRAVGRRLVRAVREHHRIVEEERLVFVPRHEIEREIVDQVGPVLAVGEVALFAVVFEAGVGIARRPARVLPQARTRRSQTAAADPCRGRVATCRRSRWRSRLPSADGRTSSRWGPIRPKLDVVAGVDSPGHELHARRRAQRLHIAMLEPHAGGGQRSRFGVL